ncbi:hypothetical protein JXC34_01335 [Candidatus Woesearchaeota archaeon]|nr:hypothetical protein [Candidatus Woesearchaeota archaeon]
MELEKLISENIGRFFGVRSILTKSSQDKIKLFSSDIYEDLINHFQQTHYHKKQPFILANTGGSDAVLSLYANIAMSTNSKPNMLVVDRKTGNLSNFNFRYLLAALNPGSRVNYILDLFGVDRSELEGYDLNSPSFSMHDIEAFLYAREYDPRDHLERLMEKAEERISLDQEVLSLFEGAARQITEYLGKKNNYTLFVKGLADNIWANPKTHYLTDDNLYRAIVSSMNLGNKRSPKPYFFVHSLRADISEAKGLDHLRDLLKYYGLSSNGIIPINLAFVPGLMKRMDNIIPFLEDNASEAIFAQRDVKTGARFLVSKDTTDIVPSAKSVPGLSKYKQQAKERNPFEYFFPDDGNLKRTMFLSNLNIGYSYSDEKSLQDYIQIANETSVDKVIIGGAIYGPYFYRENARRMLMDPEFETLDAQLREFKKVREQFKGDVVYIMGENDLKICEDLFSLYIMELQRRETGQPRVSLTVAQQRSEMNSRYDDAKDIIDRFLYPYLIRIGKDSTRFFDEDCLDSRIVELVTAFTRIRDGKPLREQDRVLLDMDALEDSENFQIWFDYSGQIQDMDVRVTGNTMYSDVTQYKNPTTALEDIVKMAQNGTIADVLPEDLLVDTRQASQMFKIMGDKAILFVPDMTDDRRYFDKDFSIPKHKREKADRVHKRVTIANYVNLPGAWVQAGDFMERMIVEPYWPRMIEIMKDVQKTGNGFEDVSVAIIQDLQLNSLTERPYHFVKYEDYAFMQSGCVGAFCIGDLGQYRNYKEMPIENAILGGLTVSSIQRGIVNLVRPFFSLPQVEFWDSVKGNHEENTDQLYHGHSFNEALESALTQHVLDTGHDIDLQFPEFIYNPKGELIKAPVGYRYINGLGIVFSHKFSERGAGKGSAVRPTTHITSWMREMGDTSAPLDIGLGGHYHIVEMASRDNKFAAILGCMAGESGYELRRQYSGAAPFGAILHFRGDGRLQIELVSEGFLNEYQPQHPLIVEKGIDNFIRESFEERAYVLGPDVPEPMPMYRRDIKPAFARRIGGDLEAA